MAKKIIILERVSEPSDFSFKYALYADVKQERKSFYAKPNYVSEVIGLDSNILTAIKNGSLVEKIDTISYPAETDFSIIQGDLQVKLKEFQKEIDDKNPWLIYGTSFDNSNGQWSQVSPTDFKDTIVEKTTPDKGGI